MVEPISTDQEELKPCNLVMKGAIVSGVVYPAVITQLKNSYFFRNIGGTSAGALAAAATAAAEYCRQKAIQANNLTHQNDGFGLLDQLSEKLSTEGFLFSLFQANKEIQPLLDILPPVLTMLNQGKSSSNKAPLLRIFQVIQRIWPNIPASGLRFASDVVRQWKKSDYDALTQGKRLGSLWGGVVGALLAVLIAFTLACVFALFGADRSVCVIVLLLGLLLLGGGMLWAGIWLGKWLLGIAMAVIGLNDILLNKVPANYFGICTGYTDDSKPNNASRPINLTNWLHQTYSDMAGLPTSTPLTFGDLHGQKINLRMVTSNLSHGRPYVLPEGLANFIWKEDDFKDFFPKEIIDHLKEKEHEGKSSGISLPGGDKSQYHFFPIANNIPVLVAVRLSISFPLLLCAVPLYTINNDGVVGATPTETTPHDEGTTPTETTPHDEGAAVTVPTEIPPHDGLAVETVPTEAPPHDEGAVETTPTEAPPHDGETTPTETTPHDGGAVGATPTETITEDRLQKNWFSDGGICSNLPIQFFDEWLPTYPTFGVNLTSLRPIKIEPTQLSYPMEQQASYQKGPQVSQHLIYLDNNPQVYLPKAGEAYTPEWVDQDRSLPSFLNAILGTGLYHRELSQVAMPSYRERVVQIRLTPEQDGLHLDMDPAAIRALIKNGRLAGRLLTEKPAGFDFEQYQWMRLLVFMSQLQENLNELKDPLTIPDYLKVLASVQATVKANPQVFPFPQEDDWHKGTANNLQELLKLACNDWQYVSGNPNGPTQDNIVLQVSPEV